MTDLGLFCFYFCFLCPCSVKFKRWQSHVSPPIWGEITLLCRARFFWSTKEPLNWCSDPWIIESLLPSLWKISLWFPGAGGVGVDTLFPDMGALLFLPSPVCIEGRNTEQSRRWIIFDSGLTWSVGTGYELEFEYLGVSLGSSTWKLWTWASGVIILKLKKLSEFPRE